MFNHKNLDEIKNHSKINLYRIKKSKWNKKREKIHIFYKNMNWTDSNLYLIKKTIHYKKTGKWMSLCCTVGYNWTMYNGLY